MGAELTANQLHVPTRSDTYWLLEGAHNARRDSISVSNSCNSDNKHGLREHQANVNKYDQLPLNQLRDQTTWTTGCKGLQQLVVQNVQTIPSCLQLDVEQSKDKCQSRSTAYQISDTICPCCTRTAAAGTVSHSVQTFLPSTQAQAGLVGSQKDRPQAQDPSLPQTHPTASLYARDQVGSQQTKQTSQLALLHPRLFCACDDIATASRYAFATVHFPTYLTKANHTCPAHQHNPLLP